MTAESWLRGWKSVSLSQLQVQQCSSTLCLTNFSTAVLVLPTVALLTFQLRPRQTCEPVLLSLQADGLAGLSVAAMAVPQCVCFAGMAGLPASYGLYGVLVPSICYALCGSSPHLVTIIIIAVITIREACMGQLFTP